jgi:hypothetical protein
VDGRVVLGAAIAWLGGCLDELPPPLECPGEAHVAADSCTEIEPPLLGCLPPKQHACYAGPRTSCACQEGECGTGPACFPQGNCPPDVGSAAGDAARCLSLGEADAGGFGLVNEGYFCTCGCIDCIRACDGKGPTFGAARGDDGVLTGDDIIFPFLRVDTRVPERGQLGVYLRIRSSDTLVLWVFGGDPDGATTELTILRTALVPESSDGAFSTIVAYEELLDIEGRAAPLTWESETGRPSLITIIPPSAGGAILFEVDCVVPFVVDR